MLLENNPYPRDVRVRSEAESLVRAGYTVEVVAPRAPGEPRHEVVNGVTIHRFRGVDGSTHGAFGFLVEYLTASALLQLAALRALRRGATVLHLHNPPDTLFAAAAIFRLAGRRVIFDHHDLTPETIEAKFGRGALARIARICERLTFAVANHVIATNESYAEVARSRGRKPSAAVTIVRNAPPASWLERPQRTRPGTLDTLRLAYVGALSTQDGGETLAIVLAGLRRLTPPIDATLTVIGDGDRRAALEAALAEQELADRATFTGWVESERVPELLEDADVCVDPAPATDVNERSTMIKLAEYLALGKPVVAYDLRETRRTIGDAGILVAPGETEALVAALARLARDAELRARLGRDARRRAASLTWEDSERALLGAYATVLG
jgi:glycosyltransferase involved in cell wall biosynthesis